MTYDPIAYEAKANLDACREHAGLKLDEQGWERVWEGMYALLCRRKRDVADAFSLDPRRSALYGAFPELLRSACDPQIPLVYSPDLREFGLMVFDGGPAIQTFSFDPFSGKKLPESLRDRWYDDLDARGIDPHGETPLPEGYGDETWWVGRGL